MILRQTPTFQRAYKKLKKHLSDHLVHKIRDKSRQLLIAYTYSDGVLELIDFGAHENFYRNLKR